MTSETPCLPGCLTTRGRGGDVISHAPNCPNAKPSEPPACHICGQEQSKHIGAYRACPVPEPQSEPPIDWAAADESAHKFLKACWEPLSREAKEINLIAAIMRSAGRIS